MTTRTDVQTGQRKFIDDVVRKLTLGTNPVELNMTYQLPPEAGGFKAVPSKSRSTGGIRLPVLVLVNGNYAPGWYQRNGFELRREGTHSIKVIAQGDPYDGGCYQAVSW